MNRHLSFILLAAVWLTGCTKKVEVQITQPRSCISLRSDHRFFPLDMALSGTPVEFRPCFGGHDSYLWDFGDGHSSTDSMPAHTYAKPGNYEIKLTVGKKNAAFHTERRYLHVAAGLRALSAGNDALSGMAELPDGDIMVLYPKIPVQEYTLLRFNEHQELKDSITLHYKSNITDMQLTSDGNLLLVTSMSGIENTGGLIKISLQGKELWTKKLPNSFEAISASPVGNNGWIVTAKESSVFVDQFGQSQRTKIYRLTNEGDILWTAYADKLGYAMNCEVLPDGFVIAGGYADYTLPAQLIIAKFNLSGQLVWRKQIHSGESKMSFVMEGRVKLLPNNNLGVILTNVSRALYLFSPNGEFIDKRIIGDPDHKYNDFCVAAGGNLFFTQTPSTAVMCNITRTDLQGYVLGTTKYQPVYTLNLYYPWFYPRRIIPLRKGGAAAFFTRNIWRDVPSDMVMIKVNDLGLPL